MEPLGDRIRQLRVEKALPLMTVAAYLLEWIKAY